ncbi:MAG: PQQ-binding-like beta-propeller repeat protein [Candidatus Bathyarchaeota archaeon]|nr:PQQ-binding-like beta-propeller repeat protein [Candidatus Bathyarchaeum sp.]
MNKKKLYSHGVFLTLMMMSMLTVTMISPIQGQTTVGFGETQYPWANVAYDLEATGYTPSPGPQSSHLLWKSTTGTSNAPFVFSVAEGMVFTKSVFDGMVFAFDAETGETVWQTEVGRAKSPEAVIYNDGHVYTDAENYSIVRLDAVTGALNWKYYFPRDLVLATAENPVYRVNYPLVCGNDMIYVGVGDTLFCLQDQYDHCCWADMVEPFDNVKTLWTFTLPDASSYGWGGFHSPTLSGDMLYCGAFNGVVYCFNATTGEIIWNYNVPECAFMMVEQISLSDGYAVVPAGDRLVCLDAATGEFVWDALPGSLPSSVAIHDGKVFAYDTTLDGSPKLFYCFDLQTGDALWTFAPKENSAAYYYPVIADGNVYITASFVLPDDNGNPELHGWGQCLDEETGTLKWEVEMDAGPYKKGYGACVGATVISDGKWYIHNGATGYVYCFGMGPTAVSLSVTDSSLELGKDTVVYGTLSDLSPATPDVPISNAQVDLFADTTKIATVTTDANGLFYTLWNPSAEGIYAIQACYAGSTSYEPSTTITTLVQVGPATTPAQSIEPEQTEATATAPLIGTELAIIIAIVAACVLSVVAYLVLRKRK